MKAGTFAQSLGKFGSMKDVYYLCTAIRELRSHKEEERYCDAAACDTSLFCFPLPRALSLQLVASLSGSSELVVCEDLSP